MNLTQIPSEQLVEMAKQCGVTELAPALRLVREVEEVYYASKVFRMWSDEEVEQLKEMAKTMTASEIAKKIGRSYTSTEGKLRHMGVKAVKRRRWKE